MTPPPVGLKTGRRKTGRANFDTFLDITFLHAFQIYNHLLTEVNVKTMIRDQTQEH